MRKKHLVLIFVAIFSSCSLFEKQTEELEFPPDTDLALVFLNFTSSPKEFKFSAANVSVKDEKIACSQFDTTDVQSHFPPFLLGVLPLEEKILIPEGYDFQNSITASNNPGSLLVLKTYSYLDKKAKPQDVILISVGDNVTSGNTGNGFFYTFLNLNLGGIYPYGVSVSELINRELVGFICNLYNYRYLPKEKAFGLIISRKGSLPFDGFFVEPTTNVSSELYNNYNGTKYFIHVFFDGNTTFASSVSTICHELAHVLHWVNSPVEETADNIWFNEAKAMYVENLFTKKYVVSNHQPFYGYVKEFYSQGMPIVFLKDFNNKIYEYGGAYVLFTYACAGRTNLNFAPGVGGLENLRRIKGESSVNEFLKNFYINLAFGEHPDPEINKIAKEYRKINGVQVGWNTGIVDVQSAQFFLAPHIEGNTEYKIKISYYKNNYKLVSQKQLNGKTVLLFEAK